MKLNSDPYGIQHAQNRGSHYRAPITDISVAIPQAIGDLSRT
jgi:hypothetical protein